MRAIWRGAISFGLVTVPVRLYPAVRRRDVRFHELDRRTGARVRHLRVRSEPAPPTQPPARLPNFDEDVVPLRRPDSEAAAQPDPPAAPTRPAEVPRTEVLRGFEIAPGRYVEVTEEDLSELAPERTKTIDVEQFVSRSELDPLYFESAYHVVPDRDMTRPFAVLLRAMQQTNRAAICWLVLRTRRHLAALQPQGDLMLLTTLLFSDEVLPAAGLAVPLPDDLQDREVEMAELLVDTLAGPWEPDRYGDEYRERLLALIESRAAAGGVRAEREAEEPPAAASGVEELMAALKASVEEARTRRRARREGREARG